MKKVSAFTLIELLIVVSIIMILIAMVSSSNLLSYLGKARDSRRKQDLNKLARSLEDYYNDNQHYPPYDPDNGTINGVSWGGSFSPYLSSLPKDPFSPGQNYYYLTDPVSQNFYALFAKLENTQDPDIDATGCRYYGGCGPNLEYNYVIHSPNVVMFAGLPSSQAHPGIDGGGDGGDGGDGGEPSATAAPTVSGPSPTEGPTPTPSSPPGAGCAFNQCGFCTLCGGSDNSNCCGGLCKDIGTVYRCMYVGCWYAQFDVTCIFQ